MIKQVVKRRKYAVIGILAVLTLAVGVLALSGDKSNPPTVCSKNIGNLNEDVENWQNFSLVDFSTCETFKVSELEKPVLVETFAVWCHTCTLQQKEIQKLHDQSDVKSVSLNTDPNEDEEKIQQHLDRHGFEWRYSVAPSEMSKALLKEYGNVILTPPRAPVVLVCENGTRLLPTGVKPVSKLKEEIDEGC